MGLVAEKSLVGNSDRGVPRSAADRNVRPTIAMILAALVILIGFARTAGAIEYTKVEVANHRCLECHGQEKIARLKPEERLTQCAVPDDVKNALTGNEPIVRPGLYLHSGLSAANVHASIACVDCHADAKKLPHNFKLTQVTCNSCHATAANNVLQSVHADAAAKGKNAPTCVTCHGGHDILRSNERESRTYPLNIIKVCGECHQKQHEERPDGMTGTVRVASYMDSVHGKAVANGLKVAATCADCHGNHKILAAANPDSPVNRAKVASTCGGCHVGIAEMYTSSIHGVAMAKGNPRAPVCVDCHTAHRISRTDAPAFMLDIVNECGQCHDKLKDVTTRKTSLYETYRRSYHGQVTQLGYTRAARCSDCHGAHDIQKINDPRSRLSEANRQRTCQRCHPTANAQFAMFDAHADFHDGEKYPLLHGVWVYFAIMMSAAFGFFGMHCVFWFIRSLIERIKHGPHKNPLPRGFGIRRFTLVDRVNHAFVIISFFGLTITGLPLLFADKLWAKNMALFLGGVHQAGMLHRFFALILIANLIVHFAGVFRRIRKQGFFKLLFGPNTMLPRWKDLKDLAGMFRWFFRGGKKPSFDRWTYWEKFDYVAEVGGSLIIGLSGLLLWFPAFFADYLPGWIFNVASLIHGYEALLAIGFIFTIHFFNANLRLEKFPVDDVMFTGQLSEEEFKHERGAEYARLTAAGQLEALKVPAAPPLYHKIAVIGGITAMAVGITLVMLIILAGLSAI